MRDFRQAKAMAATLRAALKERGFEVAHSEALELVARQFGFDNWNILAAKIREAAPQAAVPPKPSGGALPVLPVRDLVSFPGMTLPLFVGRERSMQACRRALETDRRILLVAQKRYEDLTPGPDDLHGLGVTAVIQELINLPDGSMKLMALALERSSVARWRTEEPYLAAEITPAPHGQSGEEDLELAQAVWARFRSYANVDPIRLPAVMEAVRKLRESGPDGPGVLADVIAQHLALPLSERQELLELTDGSARLKRLLELMQEGRKAA